MKSAWFTKRKVLALGSAAAFTLGVLWLINNRPEWGGFWEDQTITESRRIDRQGRLIEQVETKTLQGGKTLWDWLSLLGVPFSLAVFGYWLQQLQQSRADEQAEVEKAIAEADQREELLQNYFDRLSELLIDKNLIAIATNLETAEDYHADGTLNPSIREQREMLNAAVNVIRARTLSILRRLGTDKERKETVVQFLIESEVISRLKLNLGRADLSDIDLTGANLKGANLVNANLSGAHLWGADLSHADLSEAILSSAVLKVADLEGADLKGADLEGADLSKANLSQATLIYADLKGANLQGSKLLNARLAYADLEDANLDHADLSGVEMQETQLDKATLCQTKLPDGETVSDRDC